MTATATRYGQMDVIASDSIVSKSLLLYGEWAQEELELLARFIAPGACVLDVGAFIGTHTLAFAQMAGATGKVYAFEPRREIFAYLQHNITSNGLSQVHGHNLALGAQPAVLTMDTLDLLHADNFGGLRLSLPHETTAGGQYEISVVTLDEMDLPRVDLLKLDVEGMESEVLAGARLMITRDRPVVFAECNSLHDGASLLAFAQESGYRVFGSVSDAYNAANFNKAAENIFGGAKELGLLLLPGERIALYQTVLEQTRLPEVETLDSLACLLLSKPQYSGEILAPFCAAHGVKPVLPSQELAAAQAATGRCEAALSEVKELAFSRLDEITALTARVETEHTALVEAQCLAFERLTEIAVLQVRRSEEEAAAQQLQLRFEAALQEFQALEQNPAIRALRRLRLLKERT